MADHTAILTQGLRAARLALSDIAAKANLHLKPDVLTRSLRRRCLAQFRQLATFLRRLIFLMALSVDLPPPAPSPEAAPRKRSGTSIGAAAAAFRLAPVTSGVFPESVRCPSGVPAPGPVAAAPVLARWAALARVLEDPAAHAERLARTIRRWRVAGEPPPMILPQPRLHRLGADLALVAGLMPGLLTAALAEAWDTS